MRKAIDNQVREAHLQSTTASGANQSRSASDNGRQNLQSSLQGFSNALDLLKTIKQTPLVDDARKKAEERLANH